MGRNLMIIASLLGAIGVMLGAFGAHAFEDTLTAAGRLDTFETAVKYHFYHTIAALVAPLLVKSNDNSLKANLSSLFFIIGVLLFSGSLYFLCFTQETFLVFITPVGGVFFIMGWLLLSYAVYKSVYDGKLK